MLAFDLLLFLNLRPAKGRLPFGGVFFCSVSDISHLWITEPKRAAAVTGIT